MAKNPTLEQVLGTALYATAQTSDILLRHWRKAQALRYDTKPDLSPVTAVDRAVERRIRQIIKGRYPQHAILGEEGGNDDSAESAWLWVIDPIDGTKSYIRGLPYFGTQVAVFYEGEVVVGVSHAPVLRETAIARRGAGAFVNRNRLKVSNVRSLKRSLVAHGLLPLFERRKLMPGLRKLCREAWGLQGFQDFWSYHLLATARLDACVEAATNIWDIAAASLIVNEAGGTVTDLRGRPIQTTTTSCIASNGWIHKAILNLFSR